MAIRPTLIRPGAECIDELCAAFFWIDHQEKKIEGAPIAHKIIVIPLHVSASAIFTRRKISVLD